MNKKIDLVVPEESLSTIDCWESIITVVFDYLKKDRSIFHTSSDFYYDSTKVIEPELTLEEIFNKTLDLKNQELIEDYLRYYESFHSIKLEVIEKDSINEMQKLIQEELYSNNPIIAFVDAYDCKFNHMYSKYHIPHAFLINGIEGDKLTIIDPTQHAESLEVDINDIYLCTQSLVKFRNIGSDKKWDPSTMIKYNFMRTNFRSTDTQNSRLENIEAFFKDIINNKSQVFKSIENSEESVNILFTWRLKNVALNIKKLTETLEKTFPQDVFNVVPLLKKCQSSWMLAGRIFIKMYYANTKQREELFNKLTELLIEIIELERTILKELASIFKLEIELEEALYEGRLPVAYAVSK